MALENWDGRSLGHGVAFLLKAREVLQNGPWSVAELELTDPDFEKLLQWGRHADGAAVKRLIYRTDPQMLPEPWAHATLQGDALAGLLLLALCSECTARLGSTRAPWSASVEALGDCSLRRTLFSEGGAALPPLREALLAAAHRFWMRSGDLEDARRNRWYQLLLLQGGIPRKDVELLPGWLSHPEGGTFLVGALEQEVPSFRAVWEALGSFRRGRISRDRAEKALSTCPFFREPHREVLDAALRSAPRQDGLGELPCGTSVLSASMRLDWPRAAREPSAILFPSFSSEEVLGARVALSVDGSAKTVWRRANGRLTPFGGGDGAIRLPLASQWTLSARGEHDEEVAEVELFEGEDAIVCFNETGSRCGEQAQAVRYVVAREPLVARPEQRVAWLEGPGLAVAAVEPGTVVTTSDGLRIWPSAAEDHAVDVGALALEVAECRQGMEVGALTVRLAHAPTLRVKAARIGSAALHIEPSAEGDEGATVLHGTVAAGSMTPEARLTATVSVEGRIFQRTLRFRAFTAASIDGLWLEPSSTVEATRLYAGALRVSLGPDFTGLDARLVAGGSSTKIDVEARRAPRVLHALGYGEPLVLCGQEPWLEGPRQLLATSIEDHGHLIGHELRDGHLRIAHRLSLDASAGYWLLVWPRSGAPIELSLDGLRIPDAAAPTDSAFAIPYEAEGVPRAVALCYGTAVLGASWAADWSMDLPTAGVDVPTLVRLIRLLSLPVLATPHLRLVAESLRQLGLPRSTDALLDNGEMGETLAVGVGDAARSLRPSGDRSRWPRVARAVLLELRLSSSEQLDALKRLMDIRFPPPSLPSGVPVSQQKLKEYEDQKKTGSGTFGAYLRLLLTAGAVHPSDAVHLTPDLQRDRLTFNLADGSRDLNPTALEGQTPKKRQALRKAELAGRRRQLGLPDETVTPILAAVVAWIRSGSVLEVMLHEALIDDRMHKRIQLELLEVLAFAGKQKTNSCPS